MSTEEGYAHRQPTRLGGRRSLAVTGSVFVVLVVALWALLGSASGLENLFSRASGQKLLVWTALGIIAVQALFMLLAAVVRRGQW